MDTRMTELDAAHRSYVDQLVTTTRTSLQDNTNGKTMMVKAEL